MDGRGQLRCPRCDRASGSKHGAVPAMVGGDRVSPLSNAISGRQATGRLARGRKHDGRSRTQCRGAAIPARDPAVAVCSGHGPLSQRPRGATPGQVQRRSTDPSRSSGGTAPWALQRGPRIARRRGPGEAHPPPLQRGHGDQTVEPVNTAAATSPQGSVSAVEAPADDIAGIEADEAAVERPRRRRANDTLRISSDGCVRFARRR